MADAAVRLGRCKPAYCCSSPPAKCGGRSTKYSQGVKSPTPKTHATPQEAQKCYIRFLLSEGYTQLGPREFHKEGQPILLLNKASKGYRLRAGKADRYMSREECTGGWIMSS